MDVNIESIVMLGVTTMFGLWVRSIYKRISEIPSKGDIDALKTALSGIKQYVDDAGKRDYEQEQKQWDKIDSLVSDMGEVKGEIKGIETIIKGKING
jgi:hypothetical protein